MMAPTQRYNIWLQCLTPTGVSFQVNVVVEGKDEAEAIGNAISHLRSHGGQVTLAFGSPPLPCPVVAAVPIDIRAYESSIIATRSLK